VPRSEFKPFMTEIQVAELNLRGQTSRGGLSVQAETPQSKI